MSYASDEPAGLRPAAPGADAPEHGAAPAWGGAAGGAPDWAAADDPPASSGAGPAGPAPDHTDTPHADMPGAEGPALDGVPARDGLAAPLISLGKRLVELTEDRPEVGLGVAFFGGLLLAAIIKRFGRR